MAAPPVGASVSRLPNKTRSVTIANTNYFLVEGIYYQPFYSGSEVMCVVVDDPATAKVSWLDDGPRLAG